MNTDTAISKGDGIDGIVSDRMVDDTNSLETTGHFSEIYRCFARFLDERTSAWKEMKGLSNVLTPDQINVFLLGCTTYENHPYFSLFTGRFVSELIQRSYNSGHNNFTFDTTMFRNPTKMYPDLDNMVAGISGTLEKPINISILGSTGTHCGYHSNNLIISITGNTGLHCGYHSKNLTFTIGGDADYQCGSSSENTKMTIFGSVGNNSGMGSPNSTYTVWGDVGPNFGSFSSNSTFTIHGRGSGCGEDAKESTFRSSNQETVQNMLKDVPPGNRIILIQDGKEEVVRDYA